MLRYSRFLVEARVKPAVDGTKKMAAGFDPIEDHKLWNDTSGKIFEAHFGRALSRNPLTRKSAPLSKLRDGTKQKMEEARKIVGHKNYEAIKEHARKAAKLVGKQISSGGFKINSVHWSSNPEDQKQIATKFGVKSKPSKADVMVTGHQQETAEAQHEVHIQGERNGVPSMMHISIKYRKGDKGEKSKSKINYANAGLDSMEQKSGAPAGSISGHRDTHQQYIRSLKYTGPLSKTSKNSVRSQYEADLKSGDPKRLERAKSFDDHEEKTKKDIAASTRIAFSKMHPDQLEKHVRDTISPNTGNDERIVDARYSTGQTVPHKVTANKKTSRFRIPALEGVKFMKPSDHVDRHLDKFEKGSMFVEPNGTGNQVTIKGKLKKPKNPKEPHGVVMTQSVKATHAHTGSFNFTTNLGGK